jgi:hypothetical protein
MMFSLSESAVRSRARRHCYVLRKSRQRRHVPSLNNRGDYMVLDFNNRIVLGERFNATLEDIHEYLSDRKAH